MARSTLISAPEGIDQDALHKEIEKIVDEHIQAAADTAALNNSMHALKQKIDLGHFGLPPPPASKFDVSFTVGKIPGGQQPDFRVAFTWHW